MRSRYAALNSGIAGPRDVLRRLHVVHREHGDEVEIVSAHDPWEYARHA
ncbi:MAG: hypothetical protein JWP48_7322 [Actinoallomurus sp.]|jgi:hypothetical protein|nr:hypothetical protein [Actinoallomurus sp.]